MRKGVFLSLTCLLSTLTFAEAVPRVEWEIVQPVESRQRLMLRTQPGRASVEIAGDSESVRLGADELLSDVVELANGWAAAGRSAGEGEGGLVVLASEGQGVRRLDLPSSESVALRLAPRLLVDRGALSGLAWVEGPTPRQTAVMVRPWLGGDWGEAVEISPRGPGSQTGLTAVTLRDRTELLLWSAFDGFDDEILFSENGTGNWTPPRRVAPGNRVPDVAPAAIAVRRGALAAWSRRSDDGYDVVVARYRKGRWSKPKVLSPGLFPRFVRRDDRTFVVYRTATPRGWGVSELDGVGRALRHSSVLATAPERPALELRGDHLELRWPDREVLSGFWSSP